MPGLGLQGRALVEIANRDTRLLRLIADISTISRQTTMLALHVDLRGVERFIFAHILVMLTKAELSL